MHEIKAFQVVVRRLLIRHIPIFTYVHPYDTSPFKFSQSLGYHASAVIIKTETVDQCLVGGQACVTALLCDG